MEVTNMAVKKAVQARAEQLEAGAFRAALTDFLIEARRVLQVVKVAALTRAARDFGELAAEYDPNGEKHGQLMTACRRCEDEARAALGHVTG